MKWRYSWKIAMISISTPKCYQGSGAQSDVTTPAELEDSFKLNNSAQILVTFLEIFLDYYRSPTTKI